MNNYKPAKDLKYWLCVFWGALLTIAVSVAAKLLQELTPALMYLNSIVNERYVYSYFSLFFGFSTVLLGINAIKVGDFRSRLTKVLFALSATPLVWGLIAWRMELYEVESVYNARMSLSPSNEAVADNKWNYILGVQFAFDSMVLAITLSLAALSVSLLHWAASGHCERSEIRYIPANQPSLFRPWLAYFIAAGITSLLLGGTVSLLVSAFFETIIPQYMATKTNVQTMLFVGIYVSVSWLLFKRVFGRSEVKRAD